MPKTTLKYEGALRGPTWSEATTSAADGSWSMKHRADGKVLHIEVEVPEVASIVEGNGVAETAVKSLTGAIVASIAVAPTIGQIEHPSCVSSDVVDETAPGLKGAISLGRFRISAELSMGIPDEVVRAIGDVAASQDVNARRAKFTEALRARDPLVRLVRVYDLLSKLVEEGRPQGHKGFVRQEDIDVFIRSSEPNVPESVGPRGLETVYTRLRNEIAHPAERPHDLAKLSEEVGRQIGNLQKLVASLLVPSKNTECR